MARTRPTCGVDAGMRTTTWSDKKQILRCLGSMTVATEDSKRTVDSSQARRAFGAFRGVVDMVEGAKEALVAAVPRGRGSGVPAAEALWAFEVGIQDARARMADWRTAETEEVWRSCLSALDQSAQLAEQLRLGAPPEGYEELYARLGELLEPLDAFIDAARRFREFGR